jgi:hypothetical protein
MTNIVYRLGSIYNAATGFSWQERLEEWAKTKYPKVWEELNTHGYVEDERGIKRMNGVDRTVKA